MTYTVNVTASVVNEDGDDVASVGRNYDVEDLAKVALAVSNAGNCLKLLCEGVEAGLVGTTDTP